MRPVTGRWWWSWAIERMDVPGISDLVPSYRSLLIEYDPTLTDHDHLIDAVARADVQLGSSPALPTKVVVIPTLYGGAHGPDLEYVAEHADLSVDQVVDIHCGVDYRVYMIGFSPGFPYLGGMSERLATPRLKTPRVRIPAGSVGIAESQTGVYPAASPGGWRLIGGTPLKLFKPDRAPPSLVVAGDYIRFTVIDSEAEYRRIEAAVAADEYQAETVQAAVAGASPGTAEDQ